MTVIHFPEIRPRYRPITVMVDLSTPLQEGDLIAWQFSHGPEVLFDYWLGPSGRDTNGRFVKRGSIHECAYMSCMKYSPADLQRGALRILGKVPSGGILQLFA